MVKSLKARTNRKPRRKSHLFDIKGIMKTIKNDLYSYYTSSEKSNQKNHNLTDFPQKILKEKDEIYNNKYRKYISEEFTSSIVNMIVLFINKSKSFPEKFQIEPNFIFQFINLLKHLLMNELEIALLTILLEKIGWTCRNYEHWTYFCILGIYSKQLAGREEESSLLIDLISKDNPEFTDIYTNWICDDEITYTIDEIEINVLLINERYKELTVPINSYCRKNFINYNGMADKIIKLSQPYGNASQGNQVEFNEKLISNHGIIESKIKLFSTINSNFNVRYSQNNFSYKYLKYNLLKKGNNEYNNNEYKENENILNFKSKISEEKKNNDYDMSLYNNSNYNLNLLKRGSSQISIKLDNFINDDFLSYA